MLSYFSIVVAQSAQVSSELAGDTVILDLKSGQYYSLNEVGTRVWNLIQKPRTVQEIHQIILDEYDVESEQCSSDLFSMLEELNAIGLIEVQHEVA
jgi:hypothetical protein